MRSIIVIPARYASSRLPGKPLLRSTGKYLVQHVYERACQASRASDVLVATDDPRIVAAVESFGGRALMTRRDHTSGTDRVAEIAQRFDADAYVNLQGDEPLVEPATLDMLIHLLDRDGDAGMATLAAPITNEEAYHSANCVKLVCDSRGRALYFSRSPIPHVPDEQPDFSLQPPRFLQHLGIYAYRKPVLLKLSQLPPAPAEELEKLEQLRALNIGLPIQVGIVSHACRGIDTPEDYRRFVREYAAQKSCFRRAA